MAQHDGRLYMFYAGSYNNEPQQIGVAVSDDGVTSRGSSTSRSCPTARPGSWNASESGHPFLFHDDDGQHYLFYQGNNDNGRTWYLSMVPIEWKNGRPEPAFKRLAEINRLTLRGRNFDCRHSVGRRGRGTRFASTTMANA